MDEHAWLKKGAAILTDIKEWRHAHPKAIFVEIEDEIHRRMMELEAQVLQDAAQASESQEWRKTPGQPAPLCPTCASPLQARGQHQRTLSHQLKHEAIKQLPRTPVKHSRSSRVSCDPF